MPPSVPLIGNGVVTLNGARLRSAPGTEMLRRRRYGLLRVGTDNQAQARQQ